MGLEAAEGAQGIGEVGFSLVVAFDQGINPGMGEVEPLPAKVIFEVHGFHMHSAKLRRIWPAMKAGQFRI